MSKNEGKYNQGGCYGQSDGTPPTIHGQLGNGIKPPGGSPKASSISSPVSSVRMLHLNAHAAVKT
jgi:hypothetical protein